MNRKNAFRSPFGLLLLTMLATAGLFLLNPADKADAGSCAGPFETQRWGKGSSCAAAQADLEAQAAAVCDDCPFDGSCGPGPTIVSQTACYFSGGQWIIDGTIEASCFLAAPQTCR